MGSTSQINHPAVLSKISAGLGTGSQLCRRLCVEPRGDCDPPFPLPDCCALPVGCHLSVPCQLCFLFAANTAAARGSGVGAWRSPPDRSLWVLVHLGGWRFVSRRILSQPPRSRSREDATGCIGLCAQ